IRDATVTGVQTCALPIFDEFPGITAQGYSNLGNNNGPYYSSNQLNYNFSGSVMRVIGRHSLSIGVEHRDYFLNFIQTNPLLMNRSEERRVGKECSGWGGW